ncbi:MAG TPA: hypothetical protein VMB05_08955 [Solirubrobacteraceae bacterium]|nr:hypothetical protein [Solirubrobacteraceae bacterium]
MLAVPKQELVVIGALALGAYVLGAVLAVLVVYLINSEGNATPQTAYGLIAVGVAEMGVTLFFIGGHSPLKYLWVGLWLIWTLIVASYVVGLVMRDFRHRAKVKQARDRALRAQQKMFTASGSEAAKAREQFRRAIKEWTFAAERVLDIQQRSTRQSAREDIRNRLERVEALVAENPGIVEVEAAMDEAERRLGRAYRAAASQAADQLAGPPCADDDSDLPEVRTVSVALGYALVIVGVGFYFFVEEVAWAAVLFVAVALLAAMNVLVARATDKFVLYGVSVFFSVLLFGAALTIARTLHEPKVQPVALLRKGSEVGMCGVYITQTKDRVYVGRLNLPKYRRPGLIFWIPTSEVELVSVGQPESIVVPKKSRDSAFAGAAEHVLARLYKERAEETAPTLKNETISEVGKKPASQKQAKKIHGLHVVTNTETREARPDKLRPKPHPPVRIDGRICTATQEVVESK